MHEAILMAKRESAYDALTRVADELAGFEPQPETFKRVRRDPIVGARIAIRMAVELIRERAAEAIGK